MYPLTLYSRESRLSLSLSRSPSKISGKTRETFDFSTNLKTKEKGIISGLDLKLKIS